MTSSYYYGLDDISKTRYEQKLMHNGIPLPDPLDEALHHHVFSQDIKLWPSIDFGDIYMYLVEKECSYTKEKFKNYKALDSYNYFLSGKVNNILSYCKKNIDVCIVTCSVQGSQTLKSHHRPWIVTSTKGVVHSGHCTCMAGLGEVCSHVAALLFTLEVATREGPPSSTSVACTWNKSVKQVKPLAAVEINFFHKRKNPYKRPCISSEMPSSSAYDAFLQAIKENQPDAPILSMLSDEDPSTATASESEDTVSFSRNTATDNSKENLPNLIDLYKKVSGSVENNSDILNTLLANSIFEQDHISNVEYLTRTQASSPLWLYQRKGRITASLFGRVLKCKSGQKDIVSTILQEKTFCNKAMKYGQINENIAKTKFKDYLEEQHVNAEILPTGFLIDRDYGYLGATPDGMVICDCCETALLEIKCPAKGRDLLIKDIQKKNFFLDYELNLKQSHNYYDQVQGQMDIWNLNKCYFVTHTNMETHIQVTKYNSEYWLSKKQQLITFFKEYILPEIVKKHCIS